MTEVLQDKDATKDANNIETHSVEETTEKETTEKETTGEMTTTEVSKTTVEKPTAMETFSTKEDPTTEETPSITDSVDDKEEDIFVDAVDNDINPENNIKAEKAEDEAESKPENNDKDYSCPCNHILVSVHSTHCGICDQEITPIKQLHEKLTELKDSTQYLKSQIEESDSVYNSYVRQYKTLSSQFEKRKDQLTTTTQQIESLKQDIEIVKTKHKDEIAHSIAIEQSKLGVETELHDLSKKLFEEANQMVNQEKEKKLKIQADHDHVKHQLEEAETELNQVETELKALRNRMADVQQEQQEPKSTHENFMLRAQLDMATMLHQRQPVEIQPTANGDDLLMQEFTQAMHALKSTSFSKVTSLAFMKHLMKVEIEPCLRLGPRINYKKLLDPILQKTCLFEPCPYWFVKNEMTLQQQQPIAPVKKSSLWDRLTSSSNNSSAEDLNDALRCYACHKLLDIDPETEEKQENIYKFKTTYFEEWNLIDSFCKDRIQSVIDFFNFLRRLKIMNDYELTLNQKLLYEEYSRLQLQMLLSR